MTNPREELVEHVVEREWEMFRRVPNRGGKASCQESPKTFSIMRAAQLASWSDALLESYLTDLKDAALAGRNLLTEKYGHMMRSTAPGEYARIASLLPAVTPRALDLIARIAPIVLAWEVTLAGTYPGIVARGRPIFSLRARDSRAVAMVMPADGPSLGVAPSGTCRWTKASSKNPGSAL